LEILRLTVVEWVVVPLVPVMVSVNVPCVAPLEVKRSVEVPVGLTEVGLKLGVTPTGCPETERATEPLKPPLAATVTVVEVVPPLCDSCRLVGDALSETSGRAATVNPTVVLWVTLPSVPVAEESIRPDRRAAIRHHSC
jgi:hypothetical protein